MVKASQYNAGTNEAEEAMRESEKGHGGVEAADAKHKYDFSSFLESLWCFGRTGTLTTF